MSPSEIQDLIERLACVIDALVEAMRFAKSTNSDIWNFAESIERLRNLGASDSALRWLVVKGYVRHAREVTVMGDDGRDFRRAGNLTFFSDTCFILTELGRTSLSQLGGNACPGNETGPSPAANSVASSEEHHTIALLSADNGAVPHWDATTRELRGNGHVIKRFKWRAANQEAILCAFQEEGWPKQVDDPLTPQPEQDSKRRLADTIKCLNRKQENQLICFRGDGTGEGVIWEWRQGECAPLGDLA